MDVGFHESPIVITWNAADILVSSVYPDFDFRPGVRAVPVCLVLLLLARQDVQPWSHGLQHGSVRCAPETVGLFPELPFVVGWALLINVCPTRCATIQRRLTDAFTLIQASTGGVGAIRQGGCV
jgi:hypothetical protein